MDRERYKNISKYTENNTLQYFDVDGFDYFRLESLLSRKFENVIFCVLEEIKRMEFLCKIHNITPEQKTKLQDLFKGAPRLNVSYSKFAMKLTFIRERCFNIIGATTYGSNFKHQAEAVNAKIACSKSLNLENGSGIARLLAYIERYWSWRGFMQSYVNKITIKKYAFPSDTYKNKKLILSNIEFTNIKRSNSHHAS